MRLQVKVRRRGSDTKFVAAVLAVGTECDIGASGAAASFHPLHATAELDGPQPEGQLLAPRLTYDSVCLQLCSL